MHAAAAAAGPSDSSSSSSSSDSDPASPAAAAVAAAAAGPITGYYVLKTGEHLGQGLLVVPSSRALSALLERNKPYLRPPGQQQSNASSSNGGSSSGSDEPPSKAAAAAATPAGQSLPRPFICVQQYITNPLLVQGQKFGLRLWVFALGPKPFRAYLYHEGLVLFSKEQYNADMDAVEAHGAAAQVGLKMQRHTHVMLHAFLVTMRQPASVSKAKQPLRLPLNALLLC
jgi:hypothetical protein